MSATGRRRRSGAGFSLSATAAVVVNHVNARARSLFDFSRHCRFFHPDISHRWIIPDAVRQIIARSLFPGRVVGGNSNPLKNDLLSAARIYACLAYHHSSSHSVTPRMPSQDCTRGRPNDTDPSARSFWKIIHFYSFLPRAPAANYIHTSGNPSPAAALRLHDVRPPEPDRTRRVILLVTDSSCVV